MERATSATSQLIDRLVTFKLREGRGFQRESVLEMHKFAVEAVAQLSAIVVELAEQLDRERAAVSGASPMSPAAQPVATDPLVRTILELSEEDRQRTYDYIRLMLMSNVRRQLSPD